MKVIIVGAGKVGFSMAQLLSAENHDVTVIEPSSERAQIMENALDIQVITGSGSSVADLKAAGVDQADMLLAVTEMDELNMVSCMLAKQYGTKTTVARVRNPEYLEIKDLSFNQRMGIDLIINPERVTAREIAAIIRNPEALNVEFYADYKIKLLELEVKPASPIANKRLCDLDSSLPYNIVAIVRSHTILVPSGQDVLLPGDHIHLMARAADMKAVESLLGFHSHKVEHVTILGGGRTGFYLARILEDDMPSVHIKIIEKNLARAQKISQRLKRTLVIHGDGSDSELLQEESIGASNVVAAITDDDKVNLLCALIARNLGVKKTICQVKRNEILPLAEQIGLDTILNPRQLTAGAILKYMRVGNIISVTLFGERAEMLELSAQPGAIVLSKPLKDLNFPKGSMIGAVLRDDQVIIPDGNFQIAANDRLLVFSLEKGIHKIEKLFRGGGKF